MAHTGDPPAAAQALDWGQLPRALLGVLALLCGNGFIVGINQVYDVDIDTVNKPFLPIAAGAALLCPLISSAVRLGVVGCATVLLKCSVQDVGVRRTG